MTWSPPLPTASASRCSSSRPPNLALAGRVHLAASMPLGNEPCSTRRRSAPSSNGSSVMTTCSARNRLSDLAGKTVEVPAGLGAGRYPARTGREIASAGGRSARASRNGPAGARGRAQGRTGRGARDPPRPGHQLPSGAGRPAAIAGQAGVRLGLRRQGRRQALRAKADAFIAGVRADGTLARMHDRYFGHIKRINAEGIARFLDDARAASYPPGAATSRRRRT
jgi:hypothetical protein